MADAGLFVVVQLARESMGICEENFFWTLTIESQCGQPVALEQNLGSRDEANIVLHASSEKKVGAFICRVLIADVANVKRLARILQEQEPNNDIVQLLSAASNLSEHIVRRQIGHIRIESHNDKEQPLERRQLDWQTIRERVIRYALLQDGTHSCDKLPSYDLLDEEDVTLNGIQRFRRRRRGPSSRTALQLFSNPALQWRQRITDRLSVPWRER